MLSGTVSAKQGLLITVSKEYRQRQRCVTFQPYVNQHKCTNQEKSLPAGLKPYDRAACRLACFLVFVPDGSEAVHAGQPG
jgi:hypothetical protein